MPGVLYGVVAFYVGVYHAAEIRRVALQPFQITVRFVARKGGGQHERGVAQEIIPHVRLIDDLILHAVEYLPYKPLV